jgi:hypothetical protein
MHIQYYLIHNGDKLREKYMLDIFKKVNIDIKDVKWMLHPNRDEINDEFINKNVTSGRSLVCDMFINAQTDMKKGQIFDTLGIVGLVELGNIEFELDLYINKIEN